MHWYAFPNTFSWFLENCSFLTRRVYHSDCISMLAYRLYVFYVKSAGTCVVIVQWDYILYFGYCYWDGGCILCTKQVVDGGSGLLATSCVVVGDCRLYWWWHLAVTGEVGELSGCSWRSKTCSIYIIKQFYYSVHMCIFRRFMWSRAYSVCCSNLTHCGVQIPVGSLECVQCWIVRRLWRLWEGSSIEV